jgi:hypothetical protein
MIGVNECPVPKVRTPMPWTAARATSAAISASLVTSIIALGEND